MFPRDALPDDFELRAALAWLGDVRASLILDLGCARGRFVRAMSASGARVVGVDRSWELLRTAFDSRRLSAVEGKRLILVTSHRRESFGPGIENICLALGEIVRRFEDAVIIFPVHLNPKVQAAVYRTLGSMYRIHLL